MAGDQTTVDPNTLSEAGRGFSAASGEVRELTARLQSMKSSSLDQTWDDAAKQKFDAIYAKHAAVLASATDLLTEISSSLATISASYPQTSSTAAGQIR